MQRHLERARVDGGQQLALLDHLAFLEQHLGEHAGDLRRTVTVADGVTVPSASSRSGCRRARRCATPTVVVSAPPRRPPPPPGPAAARPGRPAAAARPAAGAAAGWWVRCQASQPSPATSSHGDHGAEPAALVSGAAGGVPAFSRSCSSRSLFAPASQAARVHLVSSAAIPDGRSLPRAPPRPRDAIANEHPIPRRRRRLWTPCSWDPPATAPPWAHEPRVAGARPRVSPQRGCRAVRCRADRRQTATRPAAATRPAHASSSRT